MVKGKSQCVKRKTCIANSAARPILKNILPISPFCHVKAALGISPWSSTSSASYWPTPSILLCRIPSYLVKALQCPVKEVSTYWMGANISPTCWIPQNKAHEGGQVLDAHGEPRKHQLLLEGSAEHMHWEVVLSNHPVSTQNKFPMEFIFWRWAAIADILQTSAGQFFTGHGWRKRSHSGVCETRRRGTQPQRSTSVGGV